MTNTVPTPDNEHTPRRTRRRLPAPHPTLLALCWAAVLLASITAMALRAS